MRSIFEQIAELFLSFSSRRFKLYRKARLMHEEYMKVNCINIENITNEQQLNAIESLELKEVENLYIQSLKLTLADNSTNNLATLYQQIGLLHFLKGELEQSQRFYKESLSILHNLLHYDTKELDEVSTCNLYLSLIALNKGDVVLAKEHILKSIEIDKSLNNIMFLNMDNRILSKCE
jgi:tetratricopeptide (TPR) repeat protein